jgi:hypothetical protein
LLKTILWIENNQIILIKIARSFQKHKIPHQKIHPKNKKEKQTLDRETKFCGGKNRIPGNLTWL